MSRIDGDNINLGESFVFRVDSGYYDSNGRFHKTVDDKQSKAISIVDKANQEAEILIREAKNQAEQEALNIKEQILEEARAEGHKNGFEAGYQAGLAAFTADFSERLNLFNAFIDSSFDIKKRIIKSAHLEIIKLITEISHKICQKNLEIDESVLFNITLAAINLLKEKETVTIIVNPIMREQIQNIASELKLENNLISNIKIVEDSTISPDGTIVEGLSGRIDSRISSQISEITERLLNEVQMTPECQLVEEAELIFEKQNNENTEELSIEDLSKREIVVNQPETLNNDFI